MKTIYKTLGVVAALSGAFFATSPTFATEISIGGEILTSANPNNIANTASYDSSAETLTLNQYEGGAINILDNDDGITIIVKGENTVALNSESGGALSAEDGITIRGEANSKLTLKNPQGTVIKHNGLIVESGNIEIQGKEGISPKRTVFNGGTTKITTTGTGILVDGNLLAISTDANVDITSTSSYGIDLRGESTLMISGGSLKINASLTGIILDAGGSTPEKANLSFNRGQTIINSSSEAIVINYNGGVLAKSAGFNLGDGMYILEDGVEAVTTNTSTRLAKDGNPVKSVTIKQLRGTDEENSNTGDNIALYIIAFIILAGALALKTRKTSRF